MDTAVYDVQLVNSGLVVGNGRYYQFGAIKNQEFVYPFLVVNKADGSLSFYDSTEGTVFDFTKFPLIVEVTPTPTQAPAPADKLTAKEAYQVLCSYSKDALHIAKEVKDPPFIYMWCGTEDSLITVNRDYHQLLTQLGVAHHYEESAGAHNWHCWDAHIADALQFFFAE